MELGFLNGQSDRVFEQATVARELYVCVRWSSLFTWYVGHRIYYPSLQLSSAFVHPSLGSTKRRAKRCRFDLDATGGNDLTLCWNYLDSPSFK